MSTFHILSSEALTQTATLFEEWPLADVDLFEDAVHITLPDAKQYVINKHGVTQQIWVSSPFTGAHHFSYQAGAWRCTRTARILEDLLNDERTTYAS